ncbi:MAG: CYTH domain-containing protein [Bacilli bacterium]|nr:CYTH domain-containing protein [Bacilli bacterium]
MNNIGTLRFIEKIVEMLGLEVQVVINNKRKVYKHDEYEILFEEVENLGLFIEVEIIVSDDIVDVM